MSYYYSSSGSSSSSSSSTDEDNIFDKYKNKIIKGKIINSLGVKLVKIFNEEEIQNGYKFKEGKNRDNKNKGFRIIFKKDIEKYKNYGIKGTHYRSVKIEDDSSVFVGAGHFRCGKIYISKNKHNIKNKT